MKLYFVKLSNENIYSITFKDGTKIINLNCKEATK
jgi:hypothetical protein